MVSQLEAVMAVRPLMLLMALVASSRLSEAKRLMLGMKAPGVMVATSLRA